MSRSQYFRAGVGVVLYVPTGDIVLFERADLPGVWQFPQGGMDAGENPHDTLWRELQEETGLTPAHVTCTHEYPDWLYYEYTPDMRPHLRDPNTLGQMHRWFFLALQPGVVIDLATASDQEFTSHTLAPFSSLTSSPHPHDQLKCPVYTQLADFYTTTVLPK